MQPEDINQLEQYLALHPELAKRVELAPPSVKCGASWLPIDSVRFSADGLRFRLKNGKTAVFHAAGRASGRRDSRMAFFQTLLRHHFPRWSVVKILAQTNRNQHHTGAFLRVVLRKGASTRAVVIAYDDEPADLYNRILSSAVLWWDQLRRESNCSLISLLLPTGWSERLLLFLPKLAVPFECYKYDPAHSTQLRQIYPRPISTSEIHAPYVVFEYDGHIPELLAETRERHPGLDLAYRQSRWELSYLGLRVMWLDRDRGEVYFDLERPTLYGRGNEETFDRFVEDVIALRAFPPRDPGHFFYRFAPEKWLESLVIQNHRLISPQLSGTIYCQVPTCLDGERKILDLLSVTEDNRLAVIELKTDKDLDLVFQGLDYWERVDYHAKRGDFSAAGYFPGVRISDAPPLLYLVAPLFEYHRVLPLLCRYMRAETPFECVGVNSDWRRKLRILRRFSLQRGEMEQASRPGNDKRCSLRVL